MAPNVDRGDTLSPGNQLEVALRRCCPCITQLLAGQGRYKARDLAVHYRGPADWLVKVKALDSEAPAPVILFAAGESYMKALIAAEARVARGQWKADQHPGQAWAR